MSQSNLNIRQELSNYLKMREQQIQSLGKRNGTTLIGNLIRSFALENDLILKSEVDVKFSGADKGRLDFVLYSKETLYPIEIDSTAKERSLVKLMSTLSIENALPIWIRWYEGLSHELIPETIHLIDLRKVRAARIYGLDDELPFGIHQGKPLRQVVRTSPGYIDWCIKNLHHFDVEKEVLDKMQMY